MSVEINNKTKQKIDLALVKKVGEIFLKRYKKTSKAVSVAFVEGERMRQLNKNYRGIDKTTDVLSFIGEGDDLGEIIIDFSQIKRQAKKYNNSVRQELIFILIHGLLHLLGYDDETEIGRAEMEKIGNKFFDTLDSQNI